MYTMSGWPRAWLSHNLSFITVILLLKFNCYKLSESVNNDYYNAAASGSGINTATNGSISLLRFRDFEPRDRDLRRTTTPLFMDTFADSRIENATRSGRGFHFHATDSDLTIELEFIVPFFKVPIKRSMALARSVAQNVMNLNMGALINGVFIVAAGASIAAIIKLLTSALSFGGSGGGDSNTYVNAYGYKSSVDEDAALYEENTLQKNVRSLTSALESKFLEHNIDMSACIQRSICSYLKQPTHASSSDASVYAKLINAFVSVPHVDAFMRGTAVHRAIKAARDVKNCNQIYRSCKLPRLNTEFLKPMLKYLKLFNGFKF